MDHFVRLMSTNDEDTRWILEVSWSTHSLLMCMKHHQTHSYVNVDAKRTHLKWSGVVKGVHVAYGAPYEHVG